jgi:hypothetical protein
MDGDHSLTCGSLTRCVRFRLALQDNRRRILFGEDKRSLQKCRQANAPDLGSVVLTWGWRMRVLSELKAEFSRAFMWPGRMTGSPAPSAHHSRAVFVGKSHILYQNADNRRR